MRVIAVDPGLTIGLAYWDSEIKEFDAIQVHDVSVAMDTVKQWRWMHGDTEHIVEDYISAGYLTKEAKTTLKIVGAFQHGLGFQTVAPQARLSSVEHAMYHLGEKALVMHRRGRDAIAALAHAISYARKFDS